MKKSYLLFLFLVGTFLTQISLHPGLVLGIEGSRITGKVSLGYYDIVYEQSGSNACLPFVNLYLDVQYPLPRFKCLEGTFRLQNGFKIIREEKDIALSQVDLRFALPILPKIHSEILHELKNKTVPAASDPYVQNEYGYLYWHSGLSFKYNGKHFNSSIRYLFRHQDYQDAVFCDSHNQQVQFTTNAAISSKLTGCLTSKVEKIRFSEDRAIYQEGYKGHYDTLYELSIGFQWLDGILINPIYTLQKNSSQQTEYAYCARQWSILTALPLWWGTTLQCYGHLQVRDYDFPPPPSYPFEEDNTDQLHKLLVLSLSKDALTNCSLELRYTLSQSGLSMSSTRCKRQFYSLGASYTFK